MPYRLALITGSSKGLGKSLAIELAKEGTELILASRDIQKLEELAKSLPSNSKAIALCIDLSKAEDRKALIRKIHELKPDLVINNAGFGLYGNSLCHLTKENLEVLEVNAVALTEITLEAARTMVQNQIKGTIVNISSAASFQPMPEFAVYAASKAYVNSFSLALAYEYRPFGIHVLTACPGQIRTDFAKRASLNFRKKADAFSMDLPFATQKILKQIKKGTKLNTFSFIYKTMRIISFLLPAYIKNKIIKKKIEKYHNFKKVLPIDPSYGRD